MENPAGDCMMLANDEVKPSGNETRSPASTLSPGTQSFGQSTLPKWVEFDRKVKHEVLCGFSTHVYKMCS